MYRPDTSTGETVPSGEGPSPLDRLLGSAVGASVYDLVLVGVPLLLLAGVVIGQSVGASVTASVSAGSFGALALVAYGLFGAPPRAE
ncbi:hypothetical protein [Salarchaeum sp. JOR-1]|uniref:hypothetical protein n=1 Tax=Salarchaeum sp. JOR-1 TaxID=2599399 RepID=UPI001198CAFE|nr:hypothetical protein [Salarchaeum sp. JOR-1]QDX40499.1 hypothetical protein FQU85_06140 [Salarchaeum sp. JOR-1]